MYNFGIRDEKEKMREENRSSDEEINFFSDRSQLIGIFIYLFIFYFACGSQFIRMNLETFSFHFRCLRLSLRLIV